MVFPSPRTAFPHGLVHTPNKGILVLLCFRQSGPRKCVEKPSETTGAAAFVDPKAPVRETGGPPKARPVGPFFEAKLPPVVRSFLPPESTGSDRPPSGGWEQAGGLIGSRQMTVHVKVFCISRKAPFDTQTPTRQAFENESPPEL